MKLQERFYELLENLSSTENENNLRLFNSVMNDMMSDLISKNPSEAQKYIEKLEAIKWRNYLTKEEAEKIVSSMNPKAPWSMQEWKENIIAFGQPLEECPYFNEYALYTEMSKVYSDHAETIAGAMDSLLDKADKAKMLKTVYLMALDNLTDVDEKYDIRKYFINS